MTDEEAVRRVRDGERGAYRVLVDRYAGVVFGVARRYSSEPAEVEDLAQEIFIKAYAGLEDFRGTAAFPTWLYRIAVNHCRDHLRTRRPTRSLDALLEKRPGAAHELSDGRPGPEVALEREDALRRLEEALEELSPDYAVPFLLKYRQGMTYEEMATEMDVTAGALKVRVHRARKELRRILGEEG